MYISILKYEWFLSLYTNCLILIKLKMNNYTDIRQNYNS